VTQDIIEMAKQAGFNEQFADVEYDWHRFEVLVKLATAKEREACAQTCENLPIPNQVSESEGSVWDGAALDCAEAIRARG